MSFIKYIILSALLSIFLAADAQVNRTVDLKWKIKPGEVITYKTIMQEVDVEDHAELSINGLFNLLGDSTNNVDAQKFLKQINSVIANSDFTTKLQQTRKNIIDIKMFMKQLSDSIVTDTSKQAQQIKNVQAMMAKATGGVVLRGAILENGTLESFYEKNEQRNLISTFFELPGRPIKKGDSWGLDIHFLSMDQNFICDSSYKKNKVTLTNIADTKDGKVATLKYDIEEYIGGEFLSPFDNKPIKLTMKMTHKAVAIFSIDRGRWLSYDGLMSIVSTGMMTTRSTKKVSLIPE